MHKKSDTKYYLKKVYQNFSHRTLLPMKIFNELVLSQINVTLNVLGIHLKIKFVLWSKSPHEKLQNVCRHMFVDIFISQSKILVCQTIFPIVKREKLSLLLPRLKKYWLKIAFFAWILRRSEKESNERYILVQRIGCSLKDYQIGYELKSNGNTI